MLTAFQSFPITIDQLIFLKMLLKACHWVRPEDGDFVPSVKLWELWDGWSHWDLPGI